MTPRALRILYAEDNPMQQRVMEHHLHALADFSFKVSFELTEEAAFATFQSNPFDAVLVDYQLAEGDGLGLVRRIRAIDPVVPIIAVSGVAPAEVAAELVLSGADDYLDKKTLSSATIGSCLRAALRRADGLRKQLLLVPLEKPTLAKSVHELANFLARDSGQVLLVMVQHCEEAARKNALTAIQIEEVFEVVTMEFKTKGDTLVQPSPFLRPFLLEILARLFG